MQEAASVKTSPEDEDTQKDLFLIFDLCGDAYGLDIRAVIEMIGVQTITGLPEMPDYIRGIINLRGRIIPVMDMRLRLGKPMKEYDSKTCIVIVGFEEQTLGLIVDSVSEVVKIPESDVAPPPDMLQGGNRYIRAIGKIGEDVKMMLDLEKLIAEAVPG